MFHYFQYRREDFLSHYHKRSNVESVFSMIKAKFRDHVRSKTDVAMVNEVLCKIICHNICCLIQRILMNSESIQPFGRPHETRDPAQIWIRPNQSRTLSQCFAAIMSSVKSERSQRKDAALHA